MVGATAGTSNLTASSPRSPGPSWSNPRRLYSMPTVLPARRRDEVLHLLSLFT